MKNIVICCDGTNNQLDGDLTNVVRMFQIATKDAQQVAFYDPGVGTMADARERTWLGKRWSLIKGLAFGAGLTQNVWEAYRYLMRTYQPGDKVFLFGFSRGAFTIRVLAGMLHAVGLLNEGAENLLPYLWRHYRGIKTLPNDADEKERAEADAHFKAIAVLKRSFTRECPVWFLGPWDTVGSVGMYGMNQAFAYTYENPGVSIVRHAVSMDERRAGFRGNIFKFDDSPHPTQPGRKRVMNVWFPGAHCDVGGGYAWTPKESGLAMGAFAWMVREARVAGLQIREDEFRSMLAGCPPDAVAKQHDQLTRESGGLLGEFIPRRWTAWALMEFLPVRRFDWATKTKKIRWPWQGFKPRTMIRPLHAHYLHRSVVERMNTCYRPLCLPGDYKNGDIPIED